MSSTWIGAYTFAESGWIATGFPARMLRRWIKGSPAASL
jgi:hypothetical protein